MPEWIFPWIVVAVIIWPLMRVERWIHKHIQGVGLLLTNNPQAAVLIYYLALLPGVALHEFSQWILAQVLRVKVKKFRLWPEKQRGGVIRLGLVEIDKKTDTVRTTLIGIIPMITGIAAIVLIGSLRFDLDPLMSALSTGDLPTVGRALGSLIAIPDFWLWIYLIFAVANAMLPEPHDVINWWLLGGIAAGLLIFLWILDLQVLIVAGLEGPFAQLGRWMGFALAMALVIDLLVMGLISIIEIFFSRLLNRELEYQ